MIDQMDQRTFDKTFRTNEDCFEYIFSLKWKKGFCCFKCGHTKSWKGRTRFNLRCRKCRYDESVLANTVFHKLKIPLTVAFGITYHISHSKGGASSLDLARRFRINQKSAWYFKRKLHLALSKASPTNKKKKKECKSFRIDSIIVNGRKPGLNGLQQVDLNIEIFEDQNQKGKQMVGDISLPKSDKKEISELLKGKFNQPNPSINMWNFKVWLTGTHHHCSEKYLQGYKDEYMFRFNYRYRMEKIWQHLLKIMVRRKAQK